MAFGRSEENLKLVAYMQSEDYDFGQSDGVPCRMNWRVTMGRKVKQPRSRSESESE